MKKNIITILDIDFIDSQAEPLTAEEAKTIAAYFQKMRN
jgi:hypothetical protein